MSRSGRPSGASGFSPDDDAPVYVISVAAQLAGMHAQTLRQYDRLGLVIPSRTRGGGGRQQAPAEVTLTGRPNGQQTKQDLPILLKAGHGPDHQIVV